MHSRVVSCAGLPTIRTLSPVLKSIGPSALAVVRTSGPFIHQDSDTV